MLTLAVFHIEDIKNDALQTAANIALLVLGVLYLAVQISRLVGAHYIAPTER